MQNIINSRSMNGIITLTDGFCEISDGNITASNIITDDININLNGRHLSLIDNLNVKATIDDIICLSGGIYNLKNSLNYYENINDNNVTILNYEITSISSVIVNHNNNINILNNEINSISSLVVSNYNILTNNNNVNKFLILDLSNNLYKNYLTRDGIYSQYLTLDNANLYYITKAETAYVYQTKSDMNNYYNIGQSDTLFQKINQMNVYATVTQLNTLYNNLIDISGFIHNLDNISLLNFSSISSYYLTKSVAQQTYQRIDNMTGYLTTGDASIIYQTLANMIYYPTKYECVQTYMTLSNMILYYTKNEVNNLFQPKNNYLLSQDVLYYLTISSAILNFQPKTNMNDYLTVNNANILFQNSSNTLSSSIITLNSYINNTNLYINTLSSSIINLQNNLQNNYQLKGNYITSIPSILNLSRIYFYYGTGGLDSNSNYLSSGSYCIYMNLAVANEFIINYNSTQICKFNYAGLQMGNYTLNSTLLNYLSNLYNNNIQQNVFSISNNIFINNNLFNSYVYNNNSTINLMNNNVWSLSGLVYNNNNNFLYYQNTNNINLNTINNNVFSLSGLINKNNNTFLSYQNTNNINLNTINNNVFSLSGLLYNYNNNFLSYQNINNNSVNLINNNVLSISSIIFNYNSNNNTNITNLNNRITQTNNLLSANFTTAEAIAFSSVAINFVNIIGSLIEAYMILNLRSRVTNLETYKDLQQQTNFLTSDHLRYSTTEYNQLDAGTRYIVTSNDLMDFFSDNSIFNDIQNNTDDIITRNQLLNYVNSNTRNNVNSGLDFLTSQNQISDWIDKPYNSNVLAGTDYIVTLNECNTKYATQQQITSIEGEITGLQTEITGLQTEITTIESQLITLGIGQIINSVFSFTDSIVSSSVLSSEISKCMKLSGTNTLTGNIISGNDTYTFFGSKPSKIGYLSNVSSDIQIQLDSKQPIGSYLVSSSLQNYVQYDYVNSLSGKIFSYNNTQNNNLLLYTPITTLNIYNTNLYNYVNSLSGVVFSYNNIQNNNLNSYINSNNNTNIYFNNSINTISNYIYNDNIKNTNLFYYINSLSGIVFNYNNLQNNNLNSYINSNNNTNIYFNNSINTISNYIISNNNIHTYYTNYLNTISNYIINNNLNTIYFNNSINTISNYIINNNNIHTYYTNYLNTISNYIINNNLNTIYFNNAINTISNFIYNDNIRNSYYNNSINAINLSISTINSTMLTSIPSTLNVNTINIQTVYANPIKAIRLYNNQTELFFASGVATGNYNGTTQGGDNLICYSAGSIDTGSLNICNWGYISNGIRLTNNLVTITDTLNVTNLIKQNNINVATQDWCNITNSYFYNSINTISNYIISNNNINTYYNNYLKTISNYIISNNNSINTLNSLINNITNTMLTSIPNKIYFYKGSPDNNSNSNYISAGSYSVVLNLASSNEFIINYAGSQISKFNNTGIIIGSYTLNSTLLSYLVNITSDVQTQINNKIGSAVYAQLSLWETTGNQLTINATNNNWLFNVYPNANYIGLRSNINGNWSNLLFTVDTIGNIYGLNNLTLGSYTLSQTILSYLLNITSDVQTQLNTKLSTTTMSYLSISNSTYINNNYIKWDNNFNSNSIINCPANGIGVGTGDSATSSIFNLNIFSWWGIGFVDSCFKQCCIYFDLRSGIINTNKIKIKQPIYNDSTTYPTNSNELGYNNKITSTSVYSITNSFTNINSLYVLLPQAGTYIVTSTFTLNCYPQGSAQFYYSLSTNSTSLDANAINNIFFISIGSSMQVIQSLNISRIINVSNSSTSIYLIGYSTTPSLYFITTNTSSIGYIRIA